MDGRTLTEECGLRPCAAAVADLLVVETEGEAMEAEAEEVEDALEAECRCWWMLRMEDTEEDVDLRPRRPEERRKDECGVSGDGEREVRFWTEPAEEVVETRGRCCWGAGKVERAWRSGRWGVLVRRWGGGPVDVRLRRSCDARLGSRLFCAVSTMFLALGERVRLADSLNHDLREASCWKNGWGILRLLLGA